MRVTDEFMQAVVDDADWHLRAVTDGEVVKTVRARDLLRQIAQAAWECADPGHAVRHHDQPLAHRGQHRSHQRLEPVLEYMHLDNSACNLASLNLLKFLDEDGTFDVEGFKAAVEVIFTAQEILVGHADYPTEPIGETTRRSASSASATPTSAPCSWPSACPTTPTRVGPGPPPSPSLMTGHAYATSARTAARMGPFAGFAENEEHMLRVLDMHRDAAADDRRGAGARRPARRPPSRRGTTAVRARRGATACATARPRSWPRPAPSA